eukprot:TRINITY_DN2054_c0_g1_i4.p3 TRINITY_DN2054_c0_g1~~TRINITY_DN2054_c0_g1_i4.p3  ORF type:complete len:226 (-),score=41.65 TRINITY_DN2054_c0_g1_i4:145-822(-)
MPQKIVSYTSASSIHDHYPSSASVTKASDHSAIPNTPVHLTASASSNHLIDDDYTTENQFTRSVASNISSPKVRTPQQSRTSTVSVPSKAVSMSDSSTQVAEATKVLHDAPIQANVDRDSHIHTLNLRHKSLSDVPHAVSSMKQLNILNLSKNQLVEVPREIAELRNLHSLDLGSNFLSDLPDEIMYLTNLRDLDLSNNSLMYLPMGIGELQVRLSICKTTLRIP